MSLAPRVQFARRADADVAYQVFGTGPLDLVFMTNWATNMDAMWDEPSMAAYMERLGSFSRVIWYDKRGTGVSDPVPLASLPTIEQWADETGTATPLLDRAIELYQKCVDMGLGESHDVAVMVDVINSIERKKA